MPLEHKYHESLVASSMMIGWAVGAVIFIIVFGITQSVQFALLAGILLGAIFGLAVYYVRKYR